MKSRKYLSIMLSVIASLFVAFPSMGEETTPYQGSRIFWDLDSYKLIFPNGNYGRVMQLQDGRLFAINSAMQGAFSSNLGSSWSIFTIQPWPDNYQFGVPDMIQLSDGTILVGINQVPLTWGSTYHSGIYVKRSTDKGATWSDMIQVYQGSNLDKKGCWEPAFLELPSGELQCYFTNQSYYSATTTSPLEQEVCMCRSFDKGLTWSAPIVTSYRNSYRIGDGMPCPILLKNNSAIVYTIEDKGWTGRSKFTATTIRTTLSDDWKSGPVDGSSANRSIIFKDAQATDLVSAAPYLRQLPNGETVASYQGNEYRTLSTEDYYDMTVVVGDENARNFKAKSRPFAVSDNQHCLINSIAVIDTGIVVAVGNIGKAGDAATNVYMIKGYPMQRALANYGTITVDGKKTSDEKWTTSTMNQIKMGNVIKNKTGMDFLYDSQNLYVTARVIDRNICDSTTFDDGIRLMIDADDVCSTSLKPGVFKINFDVNGVAKFYSANSNGSWILGENTGIQYVVTKTASYYFFEAAIPWSKFGKTVAPVGQRMAIAATLVNVYDGGYATEDFSDVNVDAPWTWLEFKLGAMSGISNVTAETPASHVKVSVEGSNLCLSSDMNMNHIMLFTIDGKEIASVSNCGTYCQLPVTMKGLGIVRAVLANGKTESKKIIIK
jgi:hypothetical protein